MWFKLEISIGKVKTQFWVRYCSVWNELYETGHLLTSGNKNEYMWVKLDQSIVWKCNDVELLRDAIDNNLRFDKHVFFKKQIES